MTWIRLCSVILFHLTCLGISFRAVDDVCVCVVRHNTKCAHLILFFWQVGTVGEGREKVGAVHGRKIESARLDSLSLFVKNDVRLPKRQRERKKCIRRRRTKESRGQPVYSGFKLSAAAAAAYWAGNEKRALSPLSHRLPFKSVLSLSLSLF